MLRKSLAAVALLFIAAMVVNTAIALHYRWPAMFDAPGNPATIMTDFIWYGTRISPPVPAMIVFTLLALAALWRGWRGVAATVLIIALCVLMTIAGAGEPAGLPTNNVPRWAWLILGTIGGYAPLLVAALGAAELIRRFLSRRRQTAPGGLPFRH
jgi:hypothetical protein